MIQLGKKVIYAIWACSILALIIAYFNNPAIASPEYIVDFIQTFQGEMLWVYIALTLIRGFFLIPSTPFVIGGGVLFPEQLPLVLFISMVGVMFSATSLYYFADLLGFSDYLKKKNPEKIQYWEKKLKSPKSTFFVIAWSFFPLVPTDLICYVGGIIKMPFRNVFIGVFIGELVLDIFYVYCGANIFELLV